MEVSTENIELLEKDLSSRLRYNVKGVVSARVSLSIPNGESFFTEKEMDIDVELIGINTYGDISVVYSEDYDCGSDDCDCDLIILDDGNYKIEAFKPYLRPISSMTRGELKELRDIFNNIIDFDEWGLDILNSDFKRFSYLELVAIFDWFNKHHFDYLNLIEKGLAIVAPKGMYN
jgi:hypothetical protein